MRCMVSETDTENDCNPTQIWSNLSEEGWESWSHWGGCVYIMRKSSAQFNLLAEHLSLPLLIEGGNF